MTNLNVYRNGNRIGVDLPSGKMFTTLLGRDWQEYNKESVLDAVILAAAVGVQFSTFIVEKNTLSVYFPAELVSRMEATR